MSKIGDLFVRLGLKKDEFSRGIKEAKRESSSFVDSLKNIGVKGKLAFAAVGAAIAGVIAAVKDLAKQNQSLGDAVRKTAAGLSAMWDTLKASIASLDFSNLIGNLREANKLARDLYDAQDALGEIGTAYNISLAQQLQHINELKIALRDQSLTDDERIAKGEELLRIYKALEQNPSRGLERAKDSTLDYYMQRMGVQMEGRTDAELAAMRKKYVEFFKWLGTKEGEVYNEAAKKVSRQIGGIDSKLGGTYMTNAANNGKAEYARLAVSYNDKIGDKDREKIEQAVVAYYQQEAKYSGETLRIQTQINSIKAKGQTGGGATGDDEAAALQRIKESTMSQTELLQKRYDEQLAMLQKHGKDTTALTEKFQQDLVKAMSGKPQEGNLLENVMMPTEVVEAHYNELLGIFQKYNLNTDSLNAKHIALLAEAQAEEEAVFQEEENALEEWSRTWIEEFAKVNDLNLDPVMDELHQLTERTMVELEIQEAQLEKAKEMAQEFQAAVVDGFADSCEVLMGQLMGLEETNTGAIVKALLDPLAKMAVMAGSIIMAEGIATIAAKDALISFGWTGWGAVAAGAALIAAGAAASAGLAALAKGGSSTTAASSGYSGGSSGGVSTENIETEMTIYVEGRISGGDIVLSGQKTLNNWNR